MKARRLAVIDFETDPFLYDRIPKPFVCGFYDGRQYLEFWGDDCVKLIADYLEDTKTPLVVYAHNGGKFDFFFLLERLQNPLKIIGSRIAKARLGIHELRDSYSIIPVPLAVVDKGEIDYEKMERKVRHMHTAEISTYLKRDCLSLFKLVEKFRDRFGPKLTVGSTAIAELQKLHPFDAQGKSHDEFFRSWFFGGRVEYFDSGILAGDWKVYDVNSMYPHCMKSSDHPTGSKYIQKTNCRIRSNGDIVGMEDYPVYFAEIECENLGAFPLRVKGESLSFPHARGVYKVTSHELRAAIDAEKVRDIKVLRTLFPCDVINFAEYVDKFVAEKITAKQSGDKIGELFAKLLLNSAYGKFAQNPDHFYEYHIQQNMEENPPDDFQIYMEHASGAAIWRKPAATHKYFDVATAASITGAARAVLMRALAVGRRVVYCDTDSIICESLPLELHPTKLGAWKLEGSGDTIAIAGKKMYALTNTGETIKKAHKGAKLSAAQIFRIASGGVEYWRNSAPSFSIKKPAHFVERKIQSRIA